ncbi:unnamed protein product, partial [Adineta steineri]
MEMIQLEKPMLLENGIQHSILIKKYSPHNYISLDLLNNSLFPMNR